MLERDRFVGGSLMVWSGTIKPEDGLVGNAVMHERRCQFACSNVI